MMLSSSLWTMLPLKILTTGGDGRNSSPCKTWSNPTSTPRKKYKSLPLSEWSESAPVAWTLRYSSIHWLSALNPIALLYDTQPKSSRDGRVCYDCNHKKHISLYSSYSIVIIMKLNWRLACPWKPTRRRKIWKDVSHLSLLFRSFFRFAEDISPSCACFYLHDLQRNVFHCFFCQSNLIKSRVDSRNSLLRLPPPLRSIWCTCSTVDYCSDRPKVPLRKRSSKCLHAIVPVANERQMETRKIQIFPLLINWF